MRRLAKGVLNPILPEDPGVTLTSPLRYKSQADLVLALDLDRGAVWVLGRDPVRERPPRAPRGRGIGRDHGRSSLSAVIHASLYSIFPYTNAFSAFIYPFISNWKNVIGDGNCGYRIVAVFVFGDEHQWPEWVQRYVLMSLFIGYIGQWMNLPYEHWFEKPDSFYVIENAFNPCVILIAQLGSMTVFPLYSYSNRPGGTLVIGLLTEQQHFIQLQLNDGCPIPPLHVQWIHHRTEQVINWTDSYQHRIAYWNKRVARNRK
ncbi:hypothetical protein M9H77_07138 [Catharanthus roseus]|uniref:Uncharacterized protein n=1 Tax=Catharanthus roseus TaxID=4058 RepID=A0ACC0BUC7_CATRO|nr:hypothetical protein M9H77_07138 [Catharanthus roseus]